MQRSKAQIEHDRLRIAELRIERRTWHEIATEIGISETMVRKEYTRVQEEWRTGAKDFLEQQHRETLATLAKVEREAWQAWHRSCMGAAETTTRTGGEDGTVTTVKTWGRDGDPRFLDVIKGCIERRCRVLGLDAATEFRVSMELQIERRQVAQTMINAVLEVVPGLTEEQMERLAQKLIEGAGVDIPAEALAP